MAVHVASWQCMDIVDIAEVRIGAEVTCVQTEQHVAMNALQHTISLGHPGKGLRIRCDVSTAHYRELGSKLDLKLVLPKGMLCMPKPYKGRTPAGSFIYEYVMYNPAASTT